jgi:hypothetical protein
MVETVASSTGKRHGRVGISYATSEPLVPSSSPYHSKKLRFISEPKLAITLLDNWWQRASTSLERQDSLHAELELSSVRDAIVWCARWGAGREEVVATISMNTGYTHARPYSRR